MTGESEKRTAGAFKTLDEVLGNLPAYERQAKTKLTRVARVADLPKRPRILELGSASGGRVIAFQRLGCDCVGVEPNLTALKNAEMLFDRVGLPLAVREGRAEEIPFPDDEFDMVHANSVVEHIPNLDIGLAEIYRVLRPGGVFWFNAASSMSPIQAEIRGFPLFGWYPDPIKQRLIRWTHVHKNHLLGNTDAPAVNWFTSRRARQVLSKHGFRRVWDRWDVRGEDEGGLAYRIVLRVVRSSRVAKFVADVLYPGCSYCAIK